MAVNLREEQPPAAGGRPFRITVVLVLLMLIGAGVLWLRRPSLVGNPAPDFSLPDLQGNMMRLRNLRGKVVFLNAWATWCPPCRDEMPAMQRLYKRLKGPNFEMLAVSVDHDRKAVEQFVKDLGLSFPILLDPQMTIVDPYEITGYPETFIIDRNGIVLTHEIGPADWDRPSYREPLLALVDGGQWQGFR